MRSIWTIFLFLPVSLASFCGQYGVPFSLEVLPNGLPVLGCAQPSCIAQPEDGVDDSIFETDGTGQVDGFFRDGDREQNTRLTANKFKANCSRANQLACLRKNQWVGGIEFIDHPRQPLVLQCCTFDGLKFSQDVGVTTISTGEAVTGGEVVRDGRQISFDVIANVRKVIDSQDDTVSYEVTVRRMNCLPDPPEVEVQYEQDLEDEVFRVLGTAGNMTLKKDHSKEYTNSQSQEKSQENFIVSAEQMIEKRTVFKPVKKPRKKPSSDFAFGAPNFNPLESPMPKQRPQKVMNEQYQPMTVQPHPRTQAPNRPMQKASTTVNPHPTTTTPIPTTTSIFTPVTIGQFVNFGPQAVTPAPVSQIGLGFQPQTLPTIPPFFNPFALPAQQQFGIITPAPNPFIFPQHSLFPQQIPGLSAAQFGTLNANGFGHTQLSPLAQQSQVVSYGSPSISPLSSWQSFNPFASHQLWPFGQTQAFSMMGAQTISQPQPQPLKTSQPINNNENRFRVNLGEATEFVSPSLTSSAQYTNVNNQQSQQPLPFTHPNFPQFSQNFQTQNYALG
ncbi:unnamed protein product, partial [Mesorhabditis belari]|uniref:Uncharacterized protein n=1 Tax=Mesorhabditis belari TaxID=2138241 RepID=A0AAF3FL13_9BILA